MRFKTIILIAILNIFSTNSSYSQVGGKKFKVIYSDQAAFRVDGVVYFASDIKVFLKNLIAYRCLNNSDYIFKSLNINDKHIKNFINSKGHDLYRYSEILKNAIIIIKAIGFVLEHSNNQNVDNHYGRKKVVKCNISRPDIIKKLDTLHIFINKRFSSTKNYNKRLSVIDRVKMFYRTIDRRGSYELFY